MTAPRPLLALVDARGGGDGVSYVGRLLHRALDELHGAPVPLATLDPARHGAVSPSERLRFFSAVAWETAVRRRPWVLYNHVGIAQAHLRLPAVLRTPYAVFLHGVEVGEPEHNVERQAAYNAARYETIRRASLRIANSTYTAQRIERAEPALGAIVACPLALLPGRNPDAAAGDHTLLASMGPAAVIIVGRMSANERYKGHDALLEAWPAVLARVPTAQLVVVGRGDDVERLRGKAAALGAGSSVIFTGFVSDATLAALLRRSRAFAMPSRGEGFGIAYLEAMHAKLPCIGSTADAAVDVIVDGQTGYLVNPSAIGLLADCVARVLENPTLARRLGAAGHQRLNAEFTFQRFRDRLAGAISSMALPN